MGTTLDMTAEGFAALAITLPPLTADRRREVCIHEAAHAVVDALGGSFVYRVAVAPLGATSWTTEGRNGGVETNLWGICCASDPPLHFCMRWSEEDGDYITDRKRYAATIRDTERQLREIHAGGRLSRFAAEQRRQLRAHICASMAGPAADAIYAGEDVELALECWGVEPDAGDDLAKAAAMSRLLPFRNEYEHAAAITVDVLRRAAVWDRVLRLADELERVGDLDDVHPLLPAPLAAWPPSPRSRPLTRIDDPSR